METKVCTKCRVPQPLDAFHRDKSALGGRSARCKACACRHVKRYRQTNATLVAARNQAWNKAHPEWVRQYAREYARRQRKRRPQPLHQKIRDRLCARLRAVVKGAPRLSTAHLIGCTPQALLLHLEAQFEVGMTWENYGVNGWHIDHVIPCAAFNLSIPDEQRACFHWSNLRPMWATANRSKGDKIEREGKVVRGRDIRPQLIAWNGPGPIRYCRPPANWVA